MNAHFGANAGACRRGVRRSPATIPRMKFPALLAAALLGACAASPPPQAALPEELVNKLVEEYFDKQLELSPMSATSIGDSRYDDRLDETTSAGFRERQIAVDQ